MAEDRILEPLEAIQNIVLKLLNEDDREEIQYGLSLIESICRHGHDVSSASDHEKYKYEG